MQLIKKLWLKLKNLLTTHRVVFAKASSSPPLEVKDIVDGEVIFAEPVNPKEAFDRSESVDEFINSLKQK